MNKTITGILAVLLMLLVLIAWKMSDRIADGNRGSESEFRLDIGATEHIVEGTDAKSVNPRSAIKAA